MDQPELESAELCRGRLARLRGELIKRDLLGCVLLDPHDIRYATGARNMLPFMLRNPARYLFVAAEGPCILFEYDGCHHLAAGLDTIDEIRPATTVSYPASGPRLDDNARRWAAEIADLARRHGGGNRRLAIGRVGPTAAAALAAEGFDLSDVQEPVERARAIKTPQELDVIRHSIASVARAMDEMRADLRPGITENALWSRLHQSVIAQGADYIETRLLNSGPRTNPWFQETGARRLEAGDLVAHDTDVVGPGGYYADFSRTFLCGEGRPSGTQRDLYRLAWEQVHHNMALIKPGRSFREIAEAAWPIPEPYVANRYFVLMHGVGLTGEYPYVMHAMDFDAHGYDGVIEPNMTLCVESFIGDESGGEGVKLEQQVLVTETGVELLSPYPFDDTLLGREV